MKKVNDTMDGDITELKNRIGELQAIEKELSETLKQEKELNTLKSRFIATAAHEFRTPLTAILNSSELLGMVGRNCDETKYFEHIAKIQSAVKYMTSLSDDVLTMMRIEIGQTRAKPTAFDLHDFCSQLIDEYSFGEGKHHPIHFNFRCTQKKIFTDKTVLQHIISNLIANAIKYSPEGKEIIVDVSTRNNALCVAVQDHGIGIPEHDQKTLFEPFVRGSNIENRAGTGLGLSIVKKSAELLGGTVQLESTVRVGSTFTVTLPLLEEK